MMNWKECVIRRLVEKRSKDEELAKSLLKMATDRFNFFSSGHISIFTLEGIYEAIIELCHALLTIEGFKTLSHECAIEFLRNRHFSNHDVEFLHKLRKKRHGIKYYGQILGELTIKRNVEIGKTLFIKLKLIVEEKLKQ